MIRHNLYRVLPVVATAMMLASCSDSFLEPKPLSFYEPAVTFSTESGLESALAAADQQLKAYWTNTSATDLGMPIPSENLFSDMLVYGKTDDSQAFTDIKERLTPSDGFYDFDQNRLVIFWGETFNGIKYANTVISYIDKVEGLDQKVKDEYLGRAYFHRSFRYYNLAMQFGNVPFMTKLIDSPKQDYTSCSQDAILEKITLDMEFAVTHVPAQSEMKYVGQVNKGACRMLLAKCYLATGKFQEAKAQLDTLIDLSGYALMKDNFGTFYSPKQSTWPITENVIWDLHRPDNKALSANKEGIFVIPNRYGSDSGIRVKIMRNLGAQWNAAGTIKTPDNKGGRAVQCYSLKDQNYNSELDWNRAVGRGQGVNRPTFFAEKSVWYVNGKLDEGDLRHSSEVGNWVNMENLKYNDPASAYYGQNLRRYDENGNDLCTDTIRAWFGWPHYKIFLESPEDDTETATQYNGGYGDFYVYRLAEAYLLRAEAEFYLNQISAATADVNALRERAHCTQYYQTVGIDDIMDERARELVFEEWRFTELNRVSLAMCYSGKADNEGKTYTKENLSQDSFWWHRICKYNNYYNKSDKVNIKGRLYTMGAHNVKWPVRQEAIDANLYGKLWQNYGYDGYDASCPVWNTWQEAVADE